jgi:phosphohistidine phosphatase
MLRLFLLRHAEAAFSTEDYARPLSEKGQRDVAYLAEKLINKDMIPDYVICSPARRTFETCDILLKTLPSISTIYPDNIYGASVDELFQAIKKTDESYKSLLIVGHNPGIQALACMLTDKNGHDAFSSSLYSYRPCTFSSIECPINGWNDLETDKNKLKEVIAS